MWGKLSVFPHFCVKRLKNNTPIREKFGILDNFPHIPRILDFSKSFPIFGKLPPHPPQMRFHNTCHEK